MNKLLPSSSDGGQAALLSLQLLLYNRVLRCSVTVNYWEMLNFRGHEGVPTPSVHAARFAYFPHSLQQEVQRAFPEHPSQAPDHGLCPLSQICLPRKLVRCLKEQQLSSAVIPGGVRGKGKRKDSARCSCPALLHRIHHSSFAKCYSSPVPHSCIGLCAGSF